MLKAIIIACLVLLSGDHSSALDKNKCLLTVYGNSRCPSCTKFVEDYQKLKEDHELMNMDIRRVLCDIPNHPCKGIVTDFSVKLHINGKLEVEFQRSNEGKHLRDIVKEKCV
ncbi:unnamed protein product [Calicophoron daubneyi]|uniref:Uncharacterized protein n=1 Tax=Calicophoron daubneyi TaxID=300641 RepID=A0AAV2T1T4_CALDB